MVKEDEMIDVTRQVVLTEEQLEFIEKNPRGLTKEGCQLEVENWKNSHNRQTLRMYQTMLEKCKNFTTSGRTADNRTVYCRSVTGEPTWVGARQ